MQFDYDDVQSTALQALTDLDRDSGEHRSEEELHRDSHRFASVIVEVFSKHAQT